MTHYPEELQRRARAFVKLEQYAEILAHVLHFGTDRASDVAARFGLTAAQWHVVDSGWTTELSEGMRRNQRDQALRFSATLAKTRRRLAMQVPDLAALGVPAPRDPGALVQALPAAEAPHGPAIPPRVQGDSASPWAARPVAPAPPAAVPPAGLSPLPPGAETADITAFVPKVVLPFQPPPDDDSRGRPPRT